MFGSIKAILAYVHESKRYEKYRDGDIFLIVSYRSWSASVFLSFAFPLCWFSESDLVVLTNTLNQDLPDYAWRPDVELVLSPVNNAGALATQLTCLQLPIPDALTRSGDSGGHIQRGISRTHCARAYLDLLAFCRPFRPDYMRVTSGTGRGALALSFASHESNFKVPSDIYMMTTNHGTWLHNGARLSCSEVPSVQCGSLGVSWVWIFVDGIGHLSIG
jgi:hypothetical protein